MIRSAARLGSGRCSMISPPGPGRLRMVSAQAWLRNNNNDSVEEKKRFHTLAEKLVELSRKKVEVAKELSKAMDELDFVPKEDSGTWSESLEPQEELDHILTSGGREGPGRGL